MLLSSVEPRINGIQLKEIEGFDNGPVIALKVPRSWIAPHMVKFHGQQRFYSRNNSGKYQLAINEIRAAFVQSETLPEQMRNFRLQRIAKMIEGDTAVRLRKGLKYVLHIVPFDAFKAGTLHDLSSFVSGKHELPLVHWKNGLAGPRYNYEGIVTSRSAGPDWQGETYVYTQLFRTGILEAVWMPYNPNIDGEVEKNICVGYEKSTVFSIDSLLLRLSKVIDITPPICIMVSVLETKGCKICNNDQLKTEVLDSLPIQEEMILLPEVIIESFDTDIKREIRPFFDIVLNASGISRGDIQQLNGL